MIQTFIRDVIWSIQKKIPLCNNPTKEYSLAGYTMTLDINDAIQRCIYFNSFDMDETNWVYTILKTGMTVVDIGSNCGYYSLIASSIVGNTGKVYSFDPSEYNYKRFSEVIKKNKINNIELFNLGISDQVEERDLFLLTPTNYSPSFCYKDTTYFGMRPTNLGIVKLTTLDKFTDSNNINFIDLVKIDVEGYEPHVIRGMSRLLTQNKVHRILIELNEFWLAEVGSSPEKVDTLLQSYGFEVERKKIYHGHSDVISLGNLLYINKSAVKKE